MSETEYRSLRASLKLVTAPTVEPLDLDDVKSHLKVDVTTEDELIVGYISAARAKVEQDTHTALMTQTWDQTVDRFPCGSKPITLLMGPLQDDTAAQSPVFAITSYSSADVSSTLSSSNYFLDTSSLPARVCLKESGEWPTDRRTEVAGVIRFKAGYGDSPNDVPAPLLHAQRLLIGHWYMNRASVGKVGEPIAHAYDALISPYIVRFVGD